MAMSEQYNYVHVEDAWTCVCPFRFKRGARQDRCEGGQCMALVYALDDKGELTNTGRCGLLPDIEESLKEIGCLTYPNEYRGIIGPEYPDYVSVSHDENEGGGVGNE